MKLTTLRPWITARLQTLLGLDDDVLVDFVCNQLEDTAVSGTQNRSHSLTTTTINPSSPLFPYPSFFFFPFHSFLCRSLMVRRFR